MNFIKSQNPDGTIVNLYYEDWGTGNPVVFIHGWPLNHQMWEHQMRVLPEAGFRCIGYDRRGFGKSDKPWTGYNYDTFADDLKAVLDQLNLQNVTLVGFSMGGGEVVRYFSRHGGNRVSKVVLISSVAPYTLQTENNAAGVPGGVFDEIISNIKKDRPAFLTQFGKMFYGVDLVSHQVSDAVLNWNLNLALQASPKATIDCVTAFGTTDFRTEMSAIDVPALIIHGNKDNIVPIEPTSEHAAKLIPGAKFLVYDDAPHGLFITDNKKLNEDLIQFIST